MPILFALFFVFQNTIEFRGVPFLWLADISLKDPYFIVPIVMGRVDVRSVHHWYAEFATESAGEDDGLCSTGDDDSVLPEPRIRSEPVLRRSESHCYSSAVAHLERTGEKAAVAAINGSCLATRVRVAD